METRPQWPNIQELRLRGKKLEGIQLSPQRVNITQEETAQDTDGSYAHTSHDGDIQNGLCLREVSLSVRLAQGSYIEGTEGGIINYLL